MSKTFKIQLLLILAGVFLALVLWLAPRHESTDDPEVTEDELLTENAGENHLHDAAEDHDHPPAGSEAETNIWTKRLEENPELKVKLENAAKQAQKIADVQSRLDAYDSLIQLSIEENLPPYVALYSKKKAETVSTPNNWVMAGDRYFKAFRLSKNRSKAMLEGAVEAYQKALDMEPELLEAKTALGVAYVEGAALLGQMPMKGIGMLKEVLNIDPENVDALTNLGYFAIQSGQYEKAIERFEQVLSIDPRNAEAYLYLTDVYLSQGKKEKGIETLEQYKSLMDDPLVNQQVDRYIKEIRSN